MNLQVKTPSEQLELFDLKTWHSACPHDDTPAMAPVVRQEEPADVDDQGNQTDPDAPNP